MGFFRGLTSEGIFAGGYRRRNMWAGRTAIAFCAVVLSVAGVQGQINVAAGDSAGLIAAIELVNKKKASEIILGGGTYNLTSQLFVSSNLQLIGGDSIIDMGGNDRAFFIASGTVGISNLTITGGNATGGAGAQGGGGGAGLGGAIFVGNISAMASGYTGAADVTLTNVSLTNNAATGGAGSESDSDNTYGGGGGLGGSGGDGHYTFWATHGGGGGGGFGNGATGGASDPDNPGAGGAGAFTPATVIGTISGGAGGSDSGGDTGGAGGSNGGGGGGSNSSGGSWGTTGGGGGIGGQAGAQGEYASGGNGGWGGGGGGIDWDVKGKGGDGGWGGGGGGGGDGSGENYNTSGGNGGFGGAGGGHAGVGGLGGGDGGLDGYTAYGGGGMGAGGAIFVQAGSSLNIVGSTLSGNSVTGGAAGGSAATAGSAIGADIFLGANVTITLANGQNMTLQGPGGAGNTSDPNVVGHTTDPDAQGGLNIVGNSASTSTLTLNGPSYYVGSTQLTNASLIVNGVNTTSGYNLNDANLTINATNTTINSLQINSGTATINGSGNTMSSFLAYSGTTQFNGDTTITGAIESDRVLTAIVGVNANVNAGQVNVGANTTLVLTGAGTLNITGGYTGILLGSYGSPSFPAVLDLGGGTDSAPTITGAQWIGGQFAQNGWGAVRMTQTGTYTLSTPLSANVSLEQNGTGTTVLNSSVTQSSAPWYNGTTINAGTLAFGGNNALSESGTLTINAGTLDLQTFSGGAGHLVLSGGTIAGSGTLTLKADSTLQAGTIQANLAGAVNLTKSTAGTTTINGTVSTTGGFTVDGGQVNVLGGSLTQLASLVVGQSDAATMTISGGTVNVASRTVVLGQQTGAQGTLVIGNGSNTSGDVLGAEAVASGSGTGIVRFQQNFAAGSSSDTNYYFLSSIQGDITVYQEGPGTTILNPTNGSGNNYTGGTFISYGTLAYGANNALPTGTAVTMSGGTLQVGAFQGQVASLLMSPVSTIEFTLNGTALGEYGQLAVMGDFNASGILSLLVGYSAQEGDTFQIFDGGFSTGNMSIESNLGPGLYWDTSRLASDGIVQVIPEPSTIGLLLCGLAACLAGWRGGRRAASAPKKTGTAISH